MKRFALLLTFALALFVPLAKAQNPPVSNDPFDTGWNVMINEGYSAVSGAQTNNGSLSSVSFKIADSWVIREDNYILINPTISVNLVGPEYRVSANKLFPSLSGKYPVVNNMELFFDGKLGASYQSDNSQHAFAYGVGAGFEIAISPTMSIRPLDVSYVRTPLLSPSGGAFLGNHVQFEAGIGFRF